MRKNEETWDELLKIKTSGRYDSGSDRHRYPYEPTPYPVLERLADGKLLGINDVILDYGCGKGRVAFFLSYRTGAKSVGIEYDERIYAEATENKKTAVSADRVRFFKHNAEVYEVPSEVNRCFYFNPFSVELLQKVTARIIKSCYNQPREILLFFYYPSDEYISYLMTADELEFMGEIDCRDLFNEENQRERIMIFRILM